MIEPKKDTYLYAEINGKRNPLLRERYPDNRVRMIGRAFLSGWMRFYHRLDVQLDPDTPKKGPVLFLTNHDSHTTTTSLMVADPYYPWTMVPIKSDLFQWRIVGDMLDSWGAIPVNRDGEDTKAARQILNLLAEGRTVCIAAEGIRSKDGRLQSMDSSLVALTLIAARKGYPVVPLVEIGTYRALPSGSFVYRPSKITVIGGKPLDLGPWISQKATLEVKTEVARYMQNSLANLLPPKQRPLFDTKPMWNKAEYMVAKVKHARGPVAEWILDKLRRPQYQKGISFRSIFASAT